MTENNYTQVDRLFRNVITFMVAFCSIVYELGYAQLLRIMYGGTVARYAITIGLFMASFAVGAKLSEYMDDQDHSNFFRVEVYLSIVGVGGALFIVAINMFPEVLFPGKYTIVLYASHIPILLVGLLSGFELPLLSSMMDANKNSTFTALGRFNIRNGIRKTLSLFGFSTVDDDSTPDSFSEVLGVDYIGSLAGTVLYALFLYPTIGLFPTFFVLGLINALAALFYLLWFYGDVRPGNLSINIGRMAEVGKTLVMTCIILTSLFTGAVAANQQVDDTLSKTYLESQIQGEYWPGNAEITITDHSQTKYQDVTWYNRTIEGYPGTQQCLRMDTAIQMCDSWVESYHSGLVDVPASTMYEDMENKDVLVVGGGDWIAINHLRKYNTTIDHVDLDKEFYENAKNDSRLEKYHENSYRYNRLNTTQGDAFSYLKHTDKQYDMIILDLPGAKSDKMLPLYSKEFYSELYTHLEDDGLLVTWGYSRYTAPNHRKAYLNTVGSAGFSNMMEYNSYENLKGDDNVELVEHYYIFSKGEPTRMPSINQSNNSYVQNHSTKYQDLTWEPIPQYNGVRENSIFHPNYDIIVDY